MIAGTKGAIPLFNPQSGKVAIQIPASYYTDDQGDVHPRVYLIRPLKRTLFTMIELAATHWRPVDAETLTELWAKELDKIPEFSTRTIHIATGLLLPIWKRLPERNARIYRFQTDDGERVIGRQIPIEALGALGIQHTIANAGEAWNLLGRGIPLHLADNMTIRKVMVMHAHRFELSGFTPEILPLLKSFGLTTEIISWKTRLFIPTGETGREILARLIHRYPITSESQSAAA